MTARAVVAIEINMSKFRTSTTILLGMTFFHSDTFSLRENAVISQVCFITTSKNMVKFHAHICNGSTAIAMALFFWVWCSPFEELLWGQHPFLYKVIQQQANAFSGDGPAFKYHLNASLHEHIQQ